MSRRRPAGPPPADPNTRTGRAPARDTTHGTTAAASAYRPTAADVPRIRDRIMDHWSTSLEPLLDMHAGRLHFPVHPHRRPGGLLVQWSVSEWIAQVLRWLDTAELFFVTDEMTAVARHAAAKMPTYGVYEDTMPAEVGFLVWAETACEVTDQHTDMEPGERCEIKAALWGQVADTSDGPGVMLITLQDSEVMISTRPVLVATPASIRSRVISSPLCYHEEYALPYGSLPWGETAPRRVKNTAVGVAMSTWLMMSQRITTETTERAPRALRRQYERAGRREPSVRTVTLRRASTPAAQERRPGESPRSYTVRWPVSGYGYWRQTWYPSKQEHRPQFVHVPPYMKGPADAPVIGSERVNVLRR